MSFKYTIISPDYKRHVFYNQASLAEFFFSKDIENGKYVIVLPHRKFNITISGKSSGESFNYYKKEHNQDDLFELVNSCIEHGISVEDINKILGKECLKKQSEKNIDICFKEIPEDDYFRIVEELGTELFKVGVEKLMK